MDLALLVAELATLETDTSRCDGAPRRYGWKGADDAVTLEDVVADDLPAVVEDDRDDWP
jgi:hypothetical protein